MPHNVILTFLQDRLHTDRVGHSGRTLLHHLCGTYELLEAWGNPEPVCLAGLFHSIYGTVQFRHSSIGFDERALVRDVIGAPAEMLVYAFCVTQRPDALLRAGLQSDGPGGMVELLDVVARMPLLVSRMQLNALLEIEAANLLEQGGDIGGFVRRLLGMPISDGARLRLVAAMRAPRYVVH